MKSIRNTLNRWRGLSSYIVERLLHFVHYNGPGSIQVVERKMLSLFKTQELKDFEKAMDFLDCSRTLMGSAIETHRTIDEHQNDGPVEVLALAAVVKPADEFLKKNLTTITRKIEEWKLYMQVTEPERYSKIERIVNNAEKNIRVAREKAIHIEHWMRFDRSKMAPF